MICVTKIQIGLRSPAVFLFSSHVQLQLHLHALVLWHQTPDVSAFEVSLIWSKLLFTFPSLSSSFCHMSFLLLLTLSPKLSPSITRATESCEQMLSVQLPCPVALCASPLLPPLLPRSSSLHPTRGFICALPSREGKCLLSLLLLLLPCLLIATKHVRDPILTSGISGWTGHRHCLWWEGIQIGAHL